jgi:tetratricopeptide (TPR) repeat protein/ferredoxin
VIVYWLGARAFCQDVCPYGAVFGALDRVAPGRIVARGDCGDCSHCTSVCQSHVRVHQELATFGTVVDPRCLRDLDCVAACPDGKVAFAFTRPPLARAGAVGGLPRRYDLTFGEELVLAAAFLASFLALRGLYGVMPFLLAVALAAIVSTMLVIALRVARRGEVRVQKLVLSRAGRVERPGAVFLGLSSVALAFVAHSGWIRWNELAGESALEAAEQARSPSQARASTSEARTHFERCRAFGLMRSLQLDLRIARAAELAGDLAAAEATLAALPIAGRAGRPVALAHARVSAARGETERARALLAAALSELDDDDRARADGRTFEAQARTLLGTLAANDGDFARARQELELACAVPSASAYAHYQLGVVCFALGDREAALPAFERSCELDGRDADAHNNAGMLLLDLKLAARAEAHLLRAVELAPEHAAARFNLGRALLARGDRAAAEEHLLRARRAGEPYASAVDELLAWP